MTAKHFAYSVAILVVGSVAAYFVLQFIDHRAKG